MKLVLDATAIRNGLAISGEYEFFMPPSVKEEISSGKQARDLDLLIETSIKIAEPSEASIGTIREKAKETGDIGRLSETDTDVLALALDLDATILSDDYSIQNVAESLGIGYKSSITRGIKEIYIWQWRCRGCGRYFKEEFSDCPICGSGLRSVRKR